MITLRTTWLRLLGALESLMDTDLTIERDGKTYIGWRVVTEEGKGERRCFRQTIYFDGQHDADSGKYRQGDQQYMDATARVILRQLVDRVEFMAAKRHLREPVQ